MLEKIKAGQVSHIESNEAKVVGLDKGSNKSVDSFPDKNDFVSYIPSTAMFERDIRIIIAEKENAQNGGESVITPDEITADMLPSTLNGNHSLFHHPQ